MRFATRTEPCLNVAPTPIEADLRGPDRTGQDRSISAELPSVRFGVLSVCVFFFLSFFLFLGAAPTDTMRTAFLNLLLKRG